MSIWGATDTTSQWRADQAISNERGGGQRTSTVEEERLMLPSENWHENHEYAPIEGPLTKDNNRMKRFQIIQHNSNINSRQVIAKKEVNSTGKAQIPSTGLVHFRQDQSFKKKTALALGIV